MCLNNDTFKFCTCIDSETKKEESVFLKGYTWTLTRLVGLKKSLIRGKIVLPEKDLGSGLTVENMLRQLENDQVFDFDYSPSENDCLEISAPMAEHKIRYFKLLYKDGGWTEGSNPAFISITSQVAEGKIRKV